jgi:hypothetical protein
MPESENRIAWQPLTPKGIAAFADATWLRLLLVQFLFAVLIAGCVVWFVNTAWFPVVGRAVEQLPEKSELRSRKLKWSGESPRLLAESHFLAISVDVDQAGGVRSPAHIQMELSQNRIRVISLLGFVELPYPVRNRTIGIGQSELQPKWGAWRPPLLWITFGVVVVVFLLVWAVLATICFLPVWLVGFFVNRELRLESCWKLSGAAFMPGVAVIIGTIFLYGLGIFDLVELLAGGALHVIVGIIYALVSAFFAPILPESSGKKNPFK